MKNNSIGQAGQTEDSFFCRGFTQICTDKGAGGKSMFDPLKTGLKLRVLFFEPPQLNKVFSFET